MRKTLALTIALIALATAPAWAQTVPPTYNQVFENVVRHNQAKPLQNPEYERGSKILGWRVLDSKKKVIGEILDIVLSQSGAINALNVEFDRLHLGAPVMLNYGNLSITPVSGGYALGMRDSQIATLYPSLLAGVETAVGETASEYSLERMIGAGVKAEDGRSLGEVKDVLFSARGDRAAALYVELKDGVLRGKTLAVPYPGKFEQNAVGGITAVLSNDQANAVISYAGTH